MFPKKYWTIYSSWLKVSAQEFIPNSCALKISMDLRWSRIHCVLKSTAGFIFNHNEKPVFLFHQSVLQAIINSDSLYYATHIFGKQHKTVRSYQ